VRAKRDGAPAGSYEIKVVELRAASAFDRQRLAARKVFAQGNFIRAADRALRWPDVLAKYEAALAMFRAAGDREGEAAALAEIGWVHMANGENNRALEISEQAAELFRAVGDRGGEARSLRVVAWVQGLSGRRAEALATLDRSLELHRAAGDRRGEALALQTIGRVHGSMFECPRALEVSRDALALFRGLNDLRAEAHTLGLMGVYHEWMSELTEALEHYERALEIFRSLAEPRGESAMLGSLARVYNDLGEKRKAIRYHEREYALTRRGGVGTGAAILVTMGDIHNQLGEARSALELYQKALGIMGAQRLAGWEDRHHDEAKTLVAAGRVLLSTGERQKARDYFRRALQRHEQQMPAAARAGGAWETASLRGMAQIHQLLGERQPAVEHYLKALALYRGATARKSEAQVLSELAELYSLTGEPERAAEYHRQSLELRLAFKDLHGAAESHYALAVIARDLGRTADARREIEAAIEIVESLRARIAGRSLRSSYFGTVQKYFEFYVDLLMRLHAERPGEGHAAAALQAHERSRARTMLEQLAEARVDMAQGVEPPQLRRERELRARLNAAAGRQALLLSGAHTGEQAAAAADEVDALVEEYEKVEAQIRRQSPRYAELVRPAPLSIGEIQAQLLDEDTLLLEYALGSSRSYLWLVSRDSLTAVVLPPRQEIEAAARRVYALLSDGSGWAGDGATAREYTRAAAALGRVLLPPEAATRLGKKRLVVVADGALQQLPFGVLPVGGGSHASGGPRPLLLDHEVISLPSATTLSLLRHGLGERRPAAKSVAVLADPVFDPEDERVERVRAAFPGGTIVGRAAGPAAGGGRVGSTQGPHPTPEGRVAGWPAGAAEFTRLPFTRREADAILAASASGDEMKAVDFGASLETVAGGALEQYRVIHFATHGVVNGERPRASGIVLSLVNRRGEPVEGFLSLSEIYKLNLRAELVVLSACQTGLGKEVRGEGLVGLVRGFMYAGSPRVVASLWKVDDRATAALMRRFYEAMFRENLTPAAALRRARIELMSDERWSAPFYWAAFELQGEWR
jgi:CHAT domain-containing protein/tetratricopeptide (TPR) repeat protein